MKLKFCLLLLLLPFAACTPAGVGSVMTANATAVTASEKALMRNATALPFDEVIPSHQSKHVTLHPHVQLMTNCTRVISLAFSSTHNYPNTIIALKNRASIVGANAMAITNWIESGSHMYTDTHFYSCASKKHLS